MIEDWISVKLVEAEQTGRTSSRRTAANGGIIEKMEKGFLIFPEMIISTFQSTLMSLNAHEVPSKPMEAEQPHHA